MVKQKIEINVRDINETLGKLSITSFVDSNYKFEDIRPKKIEGMLFYNISEDFSLDTKTPIQYCVSQSYSTPIFLLEETEYTFSFISDKNINKEDILVFNYLKNHRHGKSNMIFTNLNDVWIANVNFRGFAGKTFIDIIYGDFKFSMMVEVRTKKLDYDNEYSQMIADLSKFSSGLLFNVNAPLYQNHILSHDIKSSAYEYFILLEFLFRPHNLPDVFEYLSRNLYYLLDNTSDLVPTVLASNIGASEMAELSFNIYHISETVEEYSIYTDGEKHYIPLMINEIKYKDSIDVPENRFFKYFLEYIRDLIFDLYVNFKNEKNQVMLKLEHYANMINSFLANRYFNEISHLDYIPLNSQVLQKKEGYREILQYYLMFEFGLKISFNDLTNNFKGFTKELSNIYEMWCYFELIDIVNDLTDSVYDFESFIDTEKWSLSLDNIKKLDYFNALVIGGYKINLELMYNCSFQHSDYYDNDVFSSYSEDLEPDNTLVIEYNGVRKFLHFDAKYKLKNSKYNPEDIHKMHTYKDAINDSIGAYILYPGDDDKTIFNETDGSFGSIGAFSLKPGATNKSKNEIKNFILNIIEDAIVKGLFENKIY